MPMYDGTTVLSLEAERGDSARIRIKGKSGDLFVGWITLAMYVFDRNPEAMEKALSDLPELMRLIRMSIEGSVTVDLNALGRDI